MPPFVRMIFSKAGGYIALAVVIAGLSLGLYIEHLRLAAASSKVELLTGQIDGWRNDLAKAIDKNKSYAETIKSLTADLKTTNDRAADANAALAAATATVEIQTQTIIQEVTHETVPGDDDPVTPDRRKLIDRLWSQYGAPGGGSNPGPAGR